MNSRKVVLILDDEKAFRERLTGIFQEWDWEAHAAHDAESALDTARQFKPDLLVTDWMLQDRQTGGDVARKLQSEINGLSVLFITGLPGAVVVDDSNDRSKVLQKPFRETQLRDAVTMLGYCKTDNRNEKTQ